MTIIEAIQKTDELKPNGYTQSQKIEWLAKLDGMIKRGIIDTHEGGDEFMRGKISIVPLESIITLLASEAASDPTFDIDGDGEITVADALALLRVAARIAPATPEIIAKGDFDGDGKITVGDALNTLRIAAGLIPAPEPDANETDLSEMLARLKKSNLYSQEDKLYTFDGKELKETETVPFISYDDETPTDTELLAYAPFDEMYIFWLESKIDYANAEYAHYNNSVTHFNDIYTAFRNDYNRTHMPKGGSFKYF